MRPPWTTTGRTSQMSVSYPELELRLAREDFQRRWSLAIVRDESARFVHEASLHYPPNVRMKNCRNYPFEQDNTIYQMPSTPNLPGPSGGPKQKPHTIHPKLRFAHACLQMTENLISLADQSNLSDLANHSVFYVCDHCPFGADNAESALNHLKSKGHVSCSEYLLPNPNDPDHEQSGLDLSILRTPRNLYNPDCSMPGWTVGDSAVFCPTCFLLLPDKLLCAYHHYSQHPGYVPKFAYGTVLESRDFIVSIHQTKCPQCKRLFPNHNLLIQHWFGSRPSCRSPFHPIELEGQMPHQIVDVYCDLCRVHFDRVPPRSPPPSQPGSTHTSGPKHKPHNHDDDRKPNSVLRWAEGFCKFCLNHVHQTHTNQLPKSSQRWACRLRIRFVGLNKRQPSQTLAAYLYQNDSALILRFLRECKLLVSYLKCCHGSRRSLFKQAKTELNKLIAQSQVCTT